MCKYIIRVTRSVPAKNIATFLSSPLSYEGQFCQRYVLHLSVWHTRLIPLRFTANPFECPDSRDSMDITPFTPLI